MTAVLGGTALAVLGALLVLILAATFRRRIGAHWYQTGVQIAVFLIVLNGLIFVVIGVATTFEGASS